MHGYSLLLTSCEAVSVAPIGPEYLVLPPSSCPRAGAEAYEKDRRNQPQPTLLRLEKSMGMPAPGRRRSQHKESTSSYAEHGHSSCLPKKKLLEEQCTEPEISISTQECGDYGSYAGMERRYYLHTSTRRVWLSCS